MRIAFFTPLSPKPSGISDYSEALLPYLAAEAGSRGGQIDVFTEDPSPGREPQPSIRVLPIEAFEPETAAYDAILYHMGNNPFHTAIYDLALRVPGIVVLHEFNLHHLLAAVTITRGDWDAYLEEVEYNGGAAALEWARRARTGEHQPDYENLPMNRRLLESSQGLIVHSDYMVRAVRRTGCRLPLRKIPHGVEIRDPGGPGARTHARRRLAQLSGLPLDDSAPVFGIFGFLKPYKRVYEALRAFARLRSTHPQARMVLVGEEHPHYPLRPLITELGIEREVGIAGYVALDDFTTAIAACNVCLNLRWPTVGETSGSLLRALALGKPTLVSAVGTFAEYPDDVAIKIPVNHREIDWLYEYMRVLLDDPALARGLGERARAYAAEVCAWPIVAAQYARFLEEMIEGRFLEPTAASVPEPEPDPGIDSEPDIDPEPDIAAEPNMETKAESTVAMVPQNGTPPVAAAAPLSGSDLEDYIVSFSHASPLMEEYVLTHLRRLVHTVEITPRGGAHDRVLELGCYMQMTPALKAYCGYGEVFGSYYGPAGQHQEQSVTSSDGVAFSCRIDLYDAERDRFPYPDGFFRTVLCCELLEHLSHDPMHMVAEINRILAPGGWLILSTPNITCLRSTDAVLHGYHPELFSSYIKPNPDGSIDPRHSREYAPREIALVAEAGGMQVELLETGEYQDVRRDFRWVREFLTAGGCSLDLRGEVIYCRARKTGPVRERWPKELYYPV